MLGRIWQWRDRCRQGKNSGLLNFPLRLRGGPHAKSVCVWALTFMSDDSPSPPIEAEVTRAHIAGFSILLPPQYQPGKVQPPRTRGVRKSLTFRARTLHTSCDLGSFSSTRRRTIGSDYSNCAEVAVATSPAFLSRSQHTVHARGSLLSR